MRPRAPIALLLAAVLSAACDAYRVPYLWATYEHPTYRFRVKVPRTWDIKRDGLGGTDVVFLAGEDDPLFRASANFVVTRRRQAGATPEELGDLARRQLEAVLNDYELLSRAPRRMGNLPAVELRGRYRGPEGSRIVRTVLGVTREMQYVATLSCREETEGAFQGTFKGILETFEVPAD